MLCAVKGFGFLTVDNIGRALGKTLNDPMRISGCISYVLSEAMKEGHLYLEWEILTEQVLEVLNKDLTFQAVTAQNVSNVLYRLVMQNSIVLDGEKVYTFRQFEAEEQTAAMVARRILYPMESLDVETELVQAQKVLGITLSEKQKLAVRMVFANPISIITGGPGTGKTTVLKVILYIHGMKCKSEVQLMAPTGRAARRMAESTGNQNASTMHMALGLLGEDYTAEFAYLEAGFVNVDETSMVDMRLAYEFFQRVKGDTRILLVGDVDQLPSVGAGDVFRQLIQCGLIPVTVLDLVYVMELIFVLAIVFHKVFLLYFFKIVEIIRTFGIYTFMNAEKFTVFLSNKGVTTVRAGETNGYSDDVSRAESLSTNLALILPVTAIIIVNKVVRSST